MAEVTQLVLAVDSRQVRTATGDLDKFGRAGDQTERQAASLGRTFKGVGTAVGVVVAALASSQVLRTADAYKELNARLQLVSRNTAEFAKAQSEVLRIAQATRVGLQQTGDLYASLARSTQALGVSQDDLLGVTQSINQALIISGTSAQSAQAALVQLGQGFASGALRGEELNSVLEQAPRLAQAIADGLGVPIGKLRELGQAGELTAERVFGALQKAAAQLNVEFQRIPLTVGQATTQAANAFSVLIGAIDESTGATEGLAGAISEVSQFVTELAANIRRANQGAEEVGFLARAFTIVSQTVRILLSDVVFVFKGIGREIGAVAAQLAALGRLDFQGFRAISEAVKADAARARAELDKYQQQVLNPFLNSQGRGTTGGADPRLIGTTPANESVGFRPRAGDTPEKPKRAGATPVFTTYDEQIAQRVGSLLEDSDLTQAKIFADTIKNLDELYFSGAINADLYESALKKLTGATSSAEEQASAFIAEQERLAELLGATESAGIAKQREDMELLTKALQDGLITEQQYLESVSARLDLVAEQSQKAKTFAEEFGLAFTSAFENAIVEGRSFSDVLKGLEQDIIRIILRKQVTEPLGEFISSGVGSFFNGLSFDGGGYTGSGSRTGGMDGKGGFLAMMHPNETVIDHTKGGSGGVSVTIINQSGAQLQGTARNNGAAPDGTALIEVVLSAAGDALANRSGPLARGLESGYGIRPSMG